ncbi:hypothetical protein [Halomicrobium salinisoli]|uniref:hypothetical protein n=1 Tax=Halomicrobium salinisoli TaxID=2878391 RepID=UPI001CF0CA0F|nr:hypothetical protein [Halomicrobium salinisoli]
MAPVGFVFLANRGNLTRAKLYEAVRQRLAKEPGCDEVRFRPSRVRPRTVTARVEPAAFLGRAYPVDEAALEVTFSYPQSVDYEYYVVQWSEPGRDFGVGWHQDEDHPELGECHVQIDHAGTTAQRSSAAFVNEHPLEVLETRLDQLRALLPQIDWSGDAPRLPDDDVPGPDR